MSDHPPLDDVLGMAETCAKLHAEKAALRAYRRLRREIIDEVARMDYGITARRAITDTYLRVYRERLGIEDQP